jgi:8-amino-7-oxononanoate synthase
MWASDDLAAVRAAGLERRLRHLEGAHAPEVRVDGRPVLLLCSNSYLGLAADPRLVEAAARATRRYGAGAGASRLVSGGTVLHRTLEERLAAREGAEAAVLYSSGYLANLGAVAGLLGRGDLVASDALNHASIVDGCRLSRARVAVYGHADPAAAARALDGPEARRALVTDTVFSMDGDRAPLPALRAGCDAAGALLVVDDAHATGVAERSRAGGERADVVVGTLSKALGSTGGFVCADGATVALLRSTSRPFLFDTAPAAAAVGAALAALDVLEAEPERPRRVAALARRLRGGLGAAGLPVLGDEACPIVPVLVGDVEPALRVADALWEAGVFAPAIRPPTVAPGACRIRATVMATHTEEQVDRAVEAFVAAWRAARLDGSDREVSCSTSS